MRASEMGECVGRVWRVLMLMLCVLMSVGSGGCAIAPDGAGHVDIPSTWTSIPDMAFYACKTLKTVTIPETITSIGKQSFVDSGLTSVTIPDGVIQIYASAFRSSLSLKSLSISDSVTEMGEYAFQECKSLNSVAIGSGLQIIRQLSFEDINSDAYGNSQLVIDLGKSNVTSIQREAFKDANIHTLILPKHRYSIRSHAFANNKISELNVDYATFIDFAAFRSNRLKSLTLSPIGGNMTVKDGAFLSNQLEEVYFKISHTLELGGDAIFGDNPKLKAENVYFNKGIFITSNTTEDTWGDLINVKCSDANGEKQCVCKQGYGNGPLTSAGTELGQNFFTCVQCTAGRSNENPSQGECEECVAGTYAASSGTVRCTACSKGKYGDEPGRNSSEGACKVCEKGKYVSSEGADVCDDCPPGNMCPKTGMEEYTKCPVGTYQDQSGKQACMQCPTGRYASTEGSAACVKCAVGRYNSHAGSVDEADCRVCAAGKYARQSGTSNCAKCGKDSFTDSSSMSVCEECPDGWTTTGVTDDGTGASYCVVDERPCVAGEMKNAATGACEECRAGKYSSEGVKCEECGAGRYTGQNGKAECSPCAAGRYGNVTGAGSEEAGCTECAEGKYVRVEGAPKCMDCPPGSYCPSPGMDKSNLCPPGNFTDTPMQVNCTACPAGRYQDSKGLAKCVLCPAGTANALSGSADATSCVACGAGRYAGQSGTAECMSCAVGQFQAESGQTECLVCSVEYDDATLTSSADHTGCMIDSALAGSGSLVEAMFEDGLALVITFTCMAVFGAVGGLVTYMREKEPVSLANYSRAEAMYTSMIPGMSVGADVVLMVGVWATSPGLGATMLLARLLHVVGGIALIVCLFGPVERVRGSSAYLDYFVRDAHVQREYLDGEFVRENVYMVQSVVLLSLCDVTMLHFLPWKKSRFFVVSEGYPSQSLMQTSLLIKTVQSSMTVACEISYLMYSNDAANPMSSPAAQALFYMNIIFGVITVVMDLLMLCMRGEILRSVETEERLESLRRQHGKSEKSDKIGGTVSARDASADGESGVDKGMVYHNEGETSVTTANPMLTSAASGARVCTITPALGAVSGGGAEGVAEEAAAAAALSDVDKEREEIARALAAIEADL